MGEFLEAHAPYWGFWLMVAIQGHFEVSRVVAALLRRREVVVHVYAAPGMDAAKLASQVREALGRG